MMTRAAAAALLAAGLTLSARAARAQSASTIRFGVVPGEESALPYYAQQKGRFAAAGLDVALTTFRDGGSVTQGVLAGALDLGVTNSGSMALAHMRGLPLSLVECGATYSARAPIAHLVVAKGSPVRGARDLSGKTIAVTTLHDMMQAIVMSWIDENGGDAKAVSFVEIPLVEQAQAIARGRVDAASMVEPAYSRAKDDLQVLGFPYSACARGKPFQTLGFIGNSGWIGRNDALAKRCAAALRSAAVWANRNPDEAGTLLSTYTKLEPAVVASYPRVAWAEANSSALVQPVIDLLSRYGFMSQPFRAADLFAS